MALVQFQAQKAIQPFKQTSVVQETKYLEQPLYQLSGHSGAINECHFSPDGTILASCAGEVILWSIDKGKVESIGALRPHKSPITSLSWSVDGSKFATASADKTIAVQDTNTGKVSRRFKEHTEIVNTVVFFRQNPNILVSGDDAGAIIASDLRQSECIVRKRTKRPITCISLIPEDKFSVADVCGNIYIDRLNEKEVKWECKLQCNSIIFGTAADPTGSYLAANESDGVLTIFSILSYSRLEDRVEGRTSNGTSVKEIVPPRTAWSPDGRLVMSGSTDRFLRIWDVESVANPVQLYSLPGHKGTVTGCDFHPYHPIVASASTDQTLIVGELGK